MITLSLRETRSALLSVSVLQRGESGGLLCIGGGWWTAFGVQGGDSTFQALVRSHVVPKTNNKSIGVFGLAHNTFGLFQVEFGAVVIKLNTIRIMALLGIITQEVFHLVVI